jgi:hypothetical protein
MGNPFDDVPLEVGVVADAALTGAAPDASDVTACGRAMPYALPWRETGTLDACWFAAAAVAAAAGEAGNVAEAGPSASEAVMTGSAGMLSAVVFWVGLFSTPLPMAFH